MYEAPACPSTRCRRHPTADGSRAGVGASQGHETRV